MNAQLKLSSYHTSLKHSDGIQVVYLVISWLVEKLKKTGRSIMYT